MLGIHEQEAFGQFLVNKKKVLSADSLEACLKAQGAMRELGIEKSLDKVIYEKGLLPEGEIQELVREFKGGDEEFIRGYRILEKLGEGAMGEVYKGVDLENTDRVVAIKILFPHLGKKRDTTQRFLQEAQICIDKLDHPNIVKGYEFGYEASKDCYFYVMEYINGVNLGRAIEQRGYFTEQVAGKIMLQVASALSQAAKFNLVHRDVKPDNIILTHNDDAKLCDLGLARDWARDLSLTRTGTVMGTPFYISPEVATGMDEFDCRSDIYSLGATIYHAVTGKVPFEGNNTMIVLYRHRSEPLVPPLAVRPEISPGFSAILEMMMAKTPEDRYQTPAELIEDLRRWQESGQPIALSKRDSLVNKMKKIVKGDMGLSGLGNPAKSTELLRIEDDEDQGDYHRQDHVEEYPLSPNASSSDFFPSAPGKSNMIQLPSLNSSSQSRASNRFFSSMERKALSSALSSLSRGKLFLLSIVISLTILLLAFVVVIVGKMLQLF